VCPYHRQKKIEKERRREEKRRIINGSDEYYTRVNFIYPNLTLT
jgi:hypothetical protein